MPCIVPCIGLGTSVVRFLVFCLGPERYPPDLPASKCEMAKVNCCKPLRPAVAFVALARPAIKLEQLTSYGHGQRIGLGTGVVGFLVSCFGPERYPLDLPASKCEMAKVNICRPLRPAVVFVALARPAGKLEPPNLVWSWPAD